VQIVPQHRGFSLIELVVILGVLALLAAVVAPGVIQRVGATRIDATREETRVLYEAMVGPGTGGTNFAFLGDIGRLPNNLQELVQRGALPNYTTATARNVGMGWRGPYVNAGTSPTDYLADGFGRMYTVAMGQVRSTGPDGIANTADDILYPPMPPMLTGGVNVTVRTITGGKTVVDPANYRVDLFYALNGAETSVQDAVAPFTFANIHPGLHAVRVVKTNNPGAGSIVAQDTIVIRPGSTTAAELWF
jgi:type II secretory pathway pseudopilin PulG